MHHQKYQYPTLSHSLSSNQTSDLLRGSPHMVLTNNTLCGLNNAFSWPLIGLRISITIHTLRKNRVFTHISPSWSPNSSPYLALHKFSQQQLAALQWLFTPSSPSQTTLTRWIFSPISLASAKHGLITTYNVNRSLCLPLFTPHPTIASRKGQRTMMSVKWFVNSDKELHNTTQIHMHLIIPLTWGQIAQCIWYYALPNCNLHCRSYSKYTMLLKLISCLRQTLLGLSSTLHFCIQYPINSMQLTAPCVFTTHSSYQHLSTSKTDAEKT